MNDLSPHTFQPGIESWIRTINGASDANKLIVFRYAAGEIASYVGKGFDRTEAIDTLQEIATEQGLVDTHGQDEIQAVIAVALDNSPSTAAREIGPLEVLEPHEVLEQQAAEPPPPNGPEDYGLPPVANNSESPTLKILSKREFVEGFMPPDYLIDGILQRGYVYAITAATGHGKTALALLIARLVGRRDGEAQLGAHAVDRGKVIYFAGENPDDYGCALLATTPLASAMERTTISASFRVCSASRKCGRRSKWKPSAQAVSTS
jgi:ABC-type multidrug transport system fused ATPase/permease subunit